MDADGFRRVRGRKGRDCAAGVADGGVGTQGVLQTACTADQDDTPRHTDGDDALDGSGGDGDATEEHPTAADLRQQWLDEVTLVRGLRAQGLPDDHPVMRAACTARDQAEQTWRDSKEPAPASVRLGRAQQRLDRAVALQAQARRAILDAEAAHRAKMETLQLEMDNCTERVRLRREQLGAVQAEVGAGTAPTAAAGQAQQAAIRKVHEAISGQVGPAIAALVEQLGTDAPAWTTLNGVLGTLAMSKATLEGAVGPQPPQATQFDIGDGTDRDRDQDAMGDGESDWSESHEIPAPRQGAEYWGKDWQGWGAEQQQATGDDQSMGTGEWWDCPAHRWPEAPRWRARGYGQWTKASWADQLEEEQDVAEDRDGQPPAARRRLDAAGGDQATKDVHGPEQARPTPQLQAPQGAEAQRGAPGAAGGGTDRGDPEEAARRHRARINRVVEMAVEAGVTPLTKHGEELLVLDPAQLEAWVAECLPAALLV